MRTGARRSRAKASPCFARSGLHPIGTELGRTLDFRQTSHEEILVESVHEARKSACAIIINPAGSPFTSVALLDALEMCDGPTIELHISTVRARETIYPRSSISCTATAVTTGFGVTGSELAIRAVDAMVGKASVAGA